MAKNPACLNLQLNSSRIEWYPVNWRQLQKFKLFNCFANCVWWSVEMHCFRRCHSFFWGVLVYLKWYRTWTFLLLNLGNGVIFEKIVSTVRPSEGACLSPHFSWWDPNGWTPSPVGRSKTSSCCCCCCCCSPSLGWIWRKRWKSLPVFFGSTTFPGKASETSYRSPLSSFQLWRRNTKDSNQSSVYFGRQSGEWDIGNRAKRKLQLDKNVGGLWWQDIICFFYVEVAILDAFVLDLDTCWCGNS